VATVTGYWINPFVALIPYPYDFRLNHHEVRHLLMFPVAAFCVPERWSTGPYRYGDQTIQVCCWKYGGTVIWGATARILLDLLSRVGEYPLSGKVVDDVEAAVVLVQAEEVVQGQAQGLAEDDPVDPGMGHDDEGLHGGGG
jgi:hypothetical protein